MKSKNVLILLLLLSSAIVVGQTNDTVKVYTLKDAFKITTPIVWCGLDYTRTVFMGSFAGKDMKEYFRGWNKLFTEEPEKFSLIRYLQRPDVELDISSVERINDSTTAIFNTEDAHRSVTNAELSELVKRYQLKRKDGVGLVFFPKVYDKWKNVGVHYAVLFDIASRKVLISQRYETSPGGTGVRNYWAESIYQALKLLSRSFTMKWPVKYGK